MTSKHYIVVLINLCIAFGYYFGNLDANETHLSSDLNNIIPICLKKDDPTLFAKDLYCNKLENVSYYTPFYVETLRFLAKFTDGNYVQALNILTFICHILFGLLWYFLFFRISQHFWIALFMSIFIRGIVWVPGYEYWGISDLWSLLPRVVYYAVLPLPFLLLNLKKSIYFFLSAFLIGLLFNFHPITGLGGILIFITYCLIVLYQEKQSFKIIFNSKLLISLILIFLGMLPFFINYITNISVATDYDLVLYQEALSAKYPDFLSIPTQFWKQWLSLKYFAYFLPIAACVFVAYRYNNTTIKLRSTYLIVLSLAIFILPNASAYIEALVNALLDINIRMSFQLVRIQKLLILSSFFAIFFLLDFFYTKKEIFKKGFPFVVIGYMLLLGISKSSVFDKVPFVSNDIIRRVLPNTLSFGNIKNGNEDADLHELLQYIKTNTPKDALFFAPDVGRSGGYRSVDLDSKGANMLIEGNPKRYIQWYKDYTQFNKGTRLEANQFLRDYNVDYVLIYIDLPEFELLYKKGKWRLYKVQ